MFAFVLFPTPFRCFYMKFLVISLVIWGDWERGTKGKWEYMRRVRFCVYIIIVIMIIIIVVVVFVLVAR